MLNVGDKVVLKTMDELLDIKGFVMDEGDLVSGNTTILWELELHDLRNAYAIEIIATTEDHDLNVRYRACFVNGKDPIEGTTSSKVFLPLGTTPKSINEEEVEYDTDVFRAGKQLKAYVKLLKKDFMVRAKDGAIQLYKDGITIEIKI